MKPIKFLVVIIVLLTVANLVYTNKLVGKGETITNLNREIKAIEHENHKLQLAIAEKGSFINLEEKLKEFGYSDPENIASLTSPEPVALNR